MLTDPALEAAIPFLRLDVHRVAEELVVEVDRVLKGSGKRRAYLGDQRCRAAVSTTLNIVDGASRRTAKDKAHKYTIALSECQEAAACLRLAAALDGAQDVAVAMERAARVSMMLHRLIERFGSSATG